MSEEKRCFPRTDRPGSGVYKGKPSPGVAFDDYRSADEHEIHHREKNGLWRSLLNFLKLGLFPMESDQLLRRARSVLARDPTFEAGHVSLSAHNGILTLRGSVPTRWMREKIAGRLLDLKGVRAVENELAVHSERNKLPQEGSLIARSITP